VNRTPRELANRAFNPTQLRLDTFSNSLFIVAYEVPSIKLDSFVSGMIACGDNTDAAATTEDIITNPLQEIADAASDSIAEDL